MKKTISVIGCGWLGLPLSKVLASNEYLVKGSTTHKEKMGQIKQAGVSAYLIDLKDENTIHSDFFMTDCLIVTIPPSSKDYLILIHNLFKAIELNEIRQLIFVSSSSVYPNLNREVFENDAESVVSKHSGIALLDIENRFTEHENFETTILRFAGLYGPGREPGRFLKQKKSIKGGLNPVNLIHLDDCIAIIVKIIKHNLWHKTFNACADEHPSKKEFYTQASLSIGLSPPDFDDKSTGFKIVNSDKLKQALNYQFIHPNPLNDV